MIDFTNAIYTEIYNEIVLKHGSAVKVQGEFVSIPTSFPTVTIDEIYNVPAEIDSGNQKYANVTYRIQVFSNADGKRTEARNLFKTVSDKLYSMNLIGKTYTTTPDVYNSSVYEIQATFEGVISKDGTIYRR